MCGRYTHLYKWRQLHRLMMLTSPPLEFAPRFNVAPTQQAPVVRAELERTATGDAGVVGRAAAMLRWGLVPSWAKDPAIGNSLINARSETAATKPAFRSAFRHRRCIVPVSGFYEWMGEKGSKGRVPYYITPPVEGGAADGEEAERGILPFAGLWESWNAPDGGMLETFVILTTEANAWMRPLHDRMPVILDAGDLDLWLDPAAAPDRIAALLHPPADDFLQRWPVSTRVNSPARDDETMIQPVAEPGFEKNLFG